MRTRLKYKPLIAIVILIYSFTTSLLAQTLPDGVTKVTELAGISEYQLQNGLKVLLFPDQSSAKTTVNITYLVGSRHEGYGETGMAHLLEHLMFKGSKNHASVTQELTEHGAAANGTTWYDRTNYYETFPSSPENLSWALSLEADRMVNSFIAQKDLDSEMTVVRNEFESGENDPGGILQERIFSTAYLWHNYGKSTIGARSDIEQVPIDRLQAFYRKYYQPDNAVLIVAGRFEVDSSLLEIAQKFGSIPKPERKLPATYTQEPTQDGERTVQLRRSGDNKVVAAAYHIPAGTAEDFAAVEVLGEVLADTPSGRLYKALVLTKLATGVGGGAYQLHDPSLLYLAASVRKDGDLLKVEKALLDTIDKVKTTPPSADEVNRAKNKLRKSSDATLRDSRSLALQLSEWIGMGDWRVFFLYRERLAKVTPDDVSRAAQSYLKRSNLTLGSFLPEEKLDRTAIAQVDKGALEKTLDHLKIDDSMSAGEEFDPSPDNIKARTTYSKISPEVELAMLSKENRGQKVNLAISFRFNNLENSMHKGMLAGFTGSMLMKGTESLTREQIKDQLISLEAIGGVSGSIASVSASFSTTRENLPALLKLIADIMKHPAFPTQELETMRERYLASLEEAKSDPETRASMLQDEILDPYPAGDPRHSTSLEEDAAAAKLVTIKAMKEFHSSLYGASRGQIALVGDFDPKEVEPLLRDLFGQWRAQGEVPYQRFISRIKQGVKGQDQSISIPDKANAVYLAALSLEIDDENPDYPALRLGNYILGGGFLNSRLATRIRQKEGLSYGISSSLSAGTLDPVGGFSVTAIAAPENIAKVKLAVKEELERAIKDGFSQEEVDAARRGYLESLKIARSQDGALTGLLSEYMYVKRDVNWLNSWESRLKAVTPAEIQQALARYINPEDLVVVTSGSLPKVK